MTNKKNISKNNIMGCIRYLEELDNYQILNDNYFYNHADEYEYFSDSRICGSFSIGEKNPITFRMIEDKKKDSNYYRYLLRIPTIINPVILGKTTPNKYTKEILENFKNAEKNGYYFKEGVAGEFICIFSVFLRARFYLRSHTIRTNNSVLSKITYPVFLPSTLTEYNLIFNDSKKNLSRDTVPFFKKILAVSHKNHINIIHAFLDYHESLKNIGIDHNIAYLKLIISIESIAMIEKNKPDFKKDFSFLSKLKIKNLDREKLEELSRLWENSGSFKSVLIFFEKYLLQDNPNFNNTLSLDEKGNKKIIPFKKTLRRIYEARSKYIHEGLRMTISKNSFKDSAYEPILEKVIDRRRITNGEILPLISYFELMVNTLLINYIEKNQVK